MDAKPFVYIIVLNWNNYSDTIECIESLEQLEYDNFNILVVDNASTDGSPNNIRKKFPDAEIIVNDINLGFAAGNNAGIKYAVSKGADYVLILNNDTVVDKNMLEILISYRGNDSNILAPKVYYYDKPDIINSLGTTINWFKLRPNISNCGQKDIGQFTGIKEVSILVGCAILISSHRIKDIGMFDEKFYMIHEDADISLRNIERGGKNLVITNAFIFHKASATLNRYSALSAYYSIRNMLYLVKKHCSLPTKIGSLCGLMFLVFKNCLRFLFISKKRKETKAFFLGIKDYLSGELGATKRVL